MLRDYNMFSFVSLIHTMNIKKQFFLLKKKPTSRIQITMVPIENGVKFVQSILKKEWGTFLLWPWIVYTYYADVNGLFPLKYPKLKQQWVINENETSSLFLWYLLIWPCIYTTNKHINNNVFGIHLGIYLVH